MVDFLLTRTDRPLSPQEWPVWPRAGPSTLVWIFEGKKKNFFFWWTTLRLGLRVCSPQEIGQSVSQTLPEALPPGNTLARKTLQAYGLVRAHMRLYTSQWRGSTWNREKLCIAAQTDFSWTWCGPPRGPRPRRRQVSTTLWGDGALNWNSSREAWAINPKRREGGPTWKTRRLGSNFLQVSLVPDMFGTPDVKTECPCDHFLRRGTHLNKISLKLWGTAASRRGEAERFRLCARASQHIPHQWAVSEFFARLTRPSLGPDPKLLGPLTEKVNVPPW